MERTMHDEQSSRIFNSSMQRPQRSVSNARALSCRIQLTSLQAEHNEDMRTTSSKRHLLNLPLAVRARIFQTALVEIAPGSGQVAIVVSVESGDPATKVSLLRVSKQIRAEAVPIYHVCNDFLVEIINFDAASLLPWWEKVKHIRILAKQDPICIATGASKPERVKAGDISLNVAYSPSWHNLRSWLCLYHSGSLFSFAPSDIRTSDASASDLLIGITAAFQSTKGLARADCSWFVAKNMLGGIRTFLIRDHDGWGSREGMLTAEDCMSDTSSDRSHAQNNRVAEADDSGSSDEDYAPSSADSHGDQTSDHSSSSESSEWQKQDMTVAGAHNLSTASLATPVDTAFGHTNRQAPKKGADSVPHPGALHSTKSDGKAIQDPADQASLSQCKPEPALKSGRQRKPLTKAMMAELEEQIHKQMAEYEQQSQFSDPSDTNSDGSSDAEGDALHGPEQVGSGENEVDEFGSALDDESFTWMEQGLSGSGGPRTTPEGPTTSQAGKTFRGDHHPILPGSKSTIRHDTKSSFEPATRASLLAKSDNTTVSNIPGTNPGSRRRPRRQRSLSEHTDEFDLDPAKVEYVTELLARHEAEELQPPQNWGLSSPAKTQDSFPSSDRTLGRPTPPSDSQVVDLTEVPDSESSDAASLPNVPTFFKRGTKMPATTTSSLEASGKAVSRSPQGRETTQVDLSTSAASPKPVRPLRRHRAGPAAYLSSSE